MVWAINPFQAPPEPDSLQSWSKLLQQLRKSAQKLSRCQIPLRNTLLLGHPGSVPPYIEGREGAREEHSPKWSRCSGKTVSLAQCMQLFSYTQSCQAALQMWDAPPLPAAPRTWNPATCQRLRRSHVACWRCGWWRASAYSCLQRKWLKSGFSLLP